MTALTFHKLENMSRTIALWTSLAAAVICGNAFFANASSLGYQLQLYVSGKETNIDLPFLLGMLLTAFVGYLIACKKSFAEVGGTIAVVGVASLFGLYHVRYIHALDPYVMALAGPAVFHLASVEFQRAAARRETSTQKSITKPETVQDRRELPEVAHESRQLAAGAAGL